MIKLKLFYTSTLLVCFLLLSCNEKEITKTEVFKLAETTKSWDGSILPNYPEGSPKVTILRIIIPPKTKLKMHKHLVINAGVLLKGELTVIDENNNTLQMKAGDALVELVNKFHYGENKGIEPAEIIVFYVGTEELPITVYKEEK